MVIWYSDVFSYSHVRLQKKSELCLPQKGIVQSNINRFDHQNIIQKVEHLIHPPNTPSASMQLYHVFIFW